MIVNIFILTYIIFAFLSLLTGLIATASGLAARGISGAGRGSDTYHRFEKRLSLVAAAVSAGLVVRIAMVPLWFWTLRSLVSEVPGAMCITGVHMVDAPVSFISSSLKILFLFLYLLWLLMNRADGRFESQPYLRARLLLLPVIGGAVILESVLDLGFILQFEPRMVGCCTSLFDNPSLDIPSVITGTSALWTWVFLGLNALFLALALPILRRSPSDLPPRGAFHLAPLSFAMLVVFFLALHTHLSPALLADPGHHCVFCLWEGRPVNLLFTALTVSGLSLAGSYGLLSMGADSPALRGYLKKILGAGVAAETAGAGLALAALGLKSLAVN